ncbi:MAG: transglutaminase family protein [Clostridiales bacterium]|nr:transglutaminase family protein [Clostridiales bacterium]
MKDLLFEYDMHLDFAPPVEEHRFTLKCIPLTDERQLINRLDVEVYPKEFLSTDKDSFGNYSIYGYTKGKHDRFFARVRGQARTGLVPYLTAKEEHQIGLFKYQTDYTRPGSAILNFAKQFESSAEKYQKSCEALNDPTAPIAYTIGSVEDRTCFHGQKIISTGATTSALYLAITLMHGLYEHFTYVQGVTDVRTTVEEAMVLGKGVCQDYSHILLSLCRIWKIPCRYVVGMLIGEGLSHAWVEICSGGCWYALDPTNNLIVDDQHIKISAGRDYRDCIVSQGVFVGRTTQTQTVAVRVKEINL